MEPNRTSSALSSLGPISGTIFKIVSGGAENGLSFFRGHIWPTIHHPRRKDPHHVLYLPGLRRPLLPPEAACGLCSRVGGWPVVGVGELGPVYGTTKHECQHRFSRQIELLDHFLRDARSLFKILNPSRT